MQRRAENLLAGSTVTTNPKKTTCHKTGQPSTFQPSKNSIQTRRHTVLSPGSAGLPLGMRYTISCIKTLL